MQTPAAYNRFPGYVLALCLTALLASGFHAVRGFLDTTIVALLLLMPVGISTAVWGLGPGIASALFAFLSVNYLFIQPYYTLAVHRPGDLLILLVFLIVAVVMSQLLGRAQAGMRAATAREQETTRLYELSTALAGLQDRDQIVHMLAEQMRIAFSPQLLEIHLIEPDISFHIPEHGTPPSRPPDLEVPMQGVRGMLGEVRFWHTKLPSSPTEKTMVKTYAGQGALVLERAALSQAEGKARLLEESDRFKSSLLSAVSHDLRTPLATIKAIASSLRSGQISWDSPARVDLVAAIDEETDHLNLLVGNLLDMSRIESGALRPDRKWNSLSEVLDSALARIRGLTTGHSILVDIPEDLPAVPVDFIQLGQVFINLISNSLKFAPPDTPVRVHAHLRDETTMLIQVSNQGPPIPTQDLQRIFDRFYRKTGADGVAGIGLGLSICKGIVDAHGGSIWAENLPDGLAFNFTIPTLMDASPKLTPPGEDLSE